MYYSVNKISLFVKDEGRGEPVLIFLHFWGGSTATWSSVTSIIKNNFRCISYDHRGWGRSEKPVSGYSIRELADDTLVLIKNMKISNYILVGHSMGGKVAQYIAAKKPVGLQKLILVAPSPSAPTILPPVILDNMRSAYISIDNMNGTIDHIFMAGDISDSLRKELIADMQNHNDHSRLGWINIALHEDVSEGINNIAVPTLIIAGQNDLVDPPQRLESEVKSLIPGSKMVTIEGVGHLMMLQKPEIVAGYIIAFVEGTF